MKVFSLLCGQLASYETAEPHTPSSMVSMSGGPHHGKAFRVEDWVQGWGDYTVPTPTYYRRETPTSSRFVFQGCP